MPTPKAAPIVLTHKQQSLLKQIARRTKNPHRLVRRAQLVLAAAAGIANINISQQLELDRGQVRLWRQRWLAIAPQLALAEAQGLSEPELLALITGGLSDEPRPGTAKFFSLEQVVEIIAIACETPQANDRPVTQWTAKELAKEAVQRGIVEKISPRSVGRFLKGSHPATAPQPLLAQR